MVSGPDEPGPENASEGDQGIVARTEQLADLAIGKLKDRMQIQSIQEDASQAANVLRRMESLSLRVIVVIFVAAAASGVTLAVVGAAPLGRLPDWYMHASMYIVLFAFVLLYIKAYQQGRRVRRVFYLLCSTVALLGFAWVLLDRIPARSLVSVGGYDDSQLRLVERGRMDELWAPIILLTLTACGLLLHQLLVGRKRTPDDQSETV